MSSKNLLYEEGAFLTGCNYWASHAGTAMWSDWRPAEVERDLKQLKEAGMNYLRVFPLWPDFQPLALLRKHGGRPVEYRYDDGQAMEKDRMVKAGMSREAIQRFDEFLLLAGKYELKVIVGLITGWMSGRLFVPTALEGRDILTDPVSIMWQVRFVRCFVGHFKESKEIIAWELGNECNCMQNINEREAAWLWTSSLAGAIRLEDDERPVLSGMHGLRPRGVWTIDDQSELLDVLTTHTYPVFTEHCDLDPVNTIRGILHSTAETRFISDIAGKPCFIEEHGTLGPMFASDRIAADFLKTCLFSLWVHNCRGLLWWCAYDQLNLPFPPYEWNATECELGMFSCDRQPKPLAGEMKSFSGFIETLPFKRLPDRIREAVCIVTGNQDDWGAAFGSFILSKQAGFDIEFQCHDQPLKDAELYLLPCIEGFNVMAQKSLDGILEKVYEGAVLYISNSNGKLRRFKDVTGLEIQTYERRTSAEEVTFDLSGEKLVLTLKSEIRLSFAAAGASAEGVERDGNPAFSVFEYGKGKVYFLAFPLELQLVRTAGAFDAQVQEPYWKLYRHIARSVANRRCVKKCHPEIGVTEHPINKCERIIALINYSPEDVEFPLAMEAGWKAAEAFYGFEPKENADGSRSLLMRHNDACVFKAFRAGSN